MTISLQSIQFESIKAQRGSLVVPMNRAAPGRGTVELAFVRLPATTTPAGPPIVFLNGGPGLSGIRFGKGRLFGFFDSLRAAGDVILLDQRGSGESTPSLACADPLVLPYERALSRDEVLRALLDSTRRCADRLAQQGVDLSAFNTNESADDVADLARALGAERVSLLGWSYGTHLAFAVMRRHPEIVARAVLAGPEGPDHTYKLPSRVQRQLEMIAERARASGTPNLVGMLEGILDRLEREPARIPWSHEDATREAIVGRFDLEWMIAEGIADMRVLARMPRWLGRMARGDFGDLARDELLRSYFGELRTGLNRSLVRVCMDCASGASPERWRRIEDEARTTLLGRTIDFPFPEIGEAVGRPELGAAFRAPLRSNVEILFITGTLDARTPADNVDDLAPGFPNHRHVVIEDAGHTDLFSPPAMQRAIRRFFEMGKVEDERVRVEPSFRFEPAV